MYEIQLENISLQPPTLSTVHLRNNYAVAPYGWRISWSTKQKKVSSLQMHFVDVEINAHYCVHVGWHKLLLCRTELSVSALRCDCNSSQRGCSTLILSSVCKRFRFYPEQFFLCTFLNGSSADYLRLSRKKSYNRDELKNKNMAQKPTPRSHTPL